MRLIQSRHSLPKSNVTEWYKSVAQDIEIVATYNLVYNAALMAEAEIGCVLCIDGLINTTGESKVCFRPLSPPVAAHVDGIWQKNELFSRAAKTFLQFLRAAVAATPPPSIRRGLFLLFPARGLRSS